MPLTSEQEEGVRIAEEERLANKRLVEVLFAKERREVIREEDIPFHGWSCTDIVMFLLEDVINEVGCSVCRLHAFICNLIPRSLQ